MVASNTAHFPASTRLEVLDIERIGSFHLGVVHQMGINLGGFDVGMTQHRLDSVDVHTIFQEQTGKGVPPAMEYTRRSKQ